MSRIYKMVVAGCLVWGLAALSQAGRRVVGIMPTGWVQGGPAAAGSGSAAVHCHVRGVFC